MSITALREKTLEALGVELAQLNRERLKLALKKSAGELTTFDRFRKLRREIARILTIIHEKRAKQGE